MVLLIVAERNTRDAAYERLGISWLVGKLYHSNCDQG
jgi:hypothetical protein